MANCAPLKVVTRSFEDALKWLSGRGFQVSANGSASTVNKNGCVAQIERSKDGHGRFATYPTMLIAGEPAELVDRGYQKFFKNSKLEVPATAEQLQTLHRFSEEIKEALNYTSLYNEGLGSVSASYQYDRVVGRDVPEESRPARPWERQ
jgi:hypothetical protein